MNNISATASDGAGHNFAVCNTNSSPTMSYLTAVASGVKDNHGVINFTSSPKIHHSIINGTTKGIFVEGGATVITQSSIIGGVFVDGGSLTCVTSDDGATTALDATCN